MYIEKEKIEELVNNMVALYNLFDEDFKQNEIVSDFEMLTSEFDDMLGDYDCVEED